MGIAETAYNDDEIFACGGVCDVGGCMEICWRKNGGWIAGRGSVVWDVCLGGRALTLVG